MMAVLAGSSGSQRHVGDARSQLALYERTPDTWHCAASDTFPPQTWSEQRPAGSEVRQHDHQLNISTQLKLLQALHDRSVARDEPPETALRVPPT